MALVRIEYFDGLGWRVRGEGEIEATTEQVAADVMAGAIQYPQRGYLDGVLVAEAQRPHGRRGKARLVRFA